MKYKRTMPKFYVLHIILFVLAVSVCLKYDYFIAITGYFIILVFEVIGLDTIMYIKGNNFVSGEYPEVWKAWSEADKKLNSPLRYKYRPEFVTSIIQVTLHTGKFQKMLKDNAGLKNFLSDENIENMKQDGRLMVLAVPICALSLMGMVWTAFFAMFT